MTKTITDKVLLIVFTLSFVVLMLNQTPLGKSIQSKVVEVVQSLIVDEKDQARLPKDHEPSAQELLRDFTIRE